MLLRSAPLPTGGDYMFEPKWDGFRARISTVDGVTVRSRRRWDMTHLVRELAGLPAGRVYDGEVIALGEDGLPRFPRLCQRMLAGHHEIPVMFIAFDLLAEEATRSSRCHTGSGAGQHPGTDPGLLALLGHLGLRKRNLLANQLAHLADRSFTSSAVD
jgi:hypothetical protein